MTMNPETGEGFDAVQVGEEDYFDPQAQDPNFPGDTGLIIKKKTFWQGDRQFDTFDTVGPKYGPAWPDGTLHVAGTGTDVAVWGLSNKEPPPGADGSPGGSTAAGTNTGSAWGFPPSIVDPGTGRHLPTPCFEDDGVTPTTADTQDAFIDITLLGAYGGDIKFPVMPESFGADFTHEYWTPRVIGLGEIVMPGGQSMETISWDSFFPAHYDSDYVSISPLDLEDPRSVAARLIWTMRFNMDCMLVVGGGMWNDRVVITNFKYMHQAGEPFDIHYSISFKRYRAPIVTTAVNPDTEKDRWYKDPRFPGQSAPLPTVGSAAVDANPEMVAIVPDAPLVLRAPDADERGYPNTGRAAIITVETTTVQFNSMHNPSLPAEALIEAGLTPPAEGETTQELSLRLSKLGPNDVNNLLKLNRWITDNNYDPYTSRLIVGSGVKYYKEQPVTAAQPTKMTPLNPVPVDLNSDGTVKQTGLQTPLPVGTPGPAAIAAPPPLNSPPVTYVPANTPVPVSTPRPVGTPGPTT